MGKVWQITACDAASSYGTGHIFVAAQPTAHVAARFLRQVLVPLYRNASWPIQQLQRSLDSFLRFCNHQRPHHGYRTRGRTPGSIFLGAREER